ncbi:hypothetical protein ACFSKU_09655 [Pontibacter silvestris]|uniref:Glycosyltransferase family 61 protein n=1 Tax=Pontibacter silvestris TaxID=2305183 RepID=A0ABW4WY83_9BACT|nr:hypothetical protein [Pontibacter silvestris]MCC9138817.1 hypothetical protein [Pontibacter silvestris]
MRSYILKIFYLIALIKYPKIRKKYRYYIRDNYYSRLIQTKYAYKDYIRKKKYKVIEYHGEFQQELLFVLPFAYWHHLNGTLYKTVGCTGTKDLYFFSKNHEERFIKREWPDYYNDTSFEVPNMAHSITFSYKKWARVPLKEHYVNDVFVFEKPILVIANKYNIEWDQQPLNYFDVKTLDRIIRYNRDKYQIVYNRPSLGQIVSDNSDILDLNEIAWLRQEHPDVILMKDLYCKYEKSVNSFNHFQLMLYANCDRFISVHGGTAALASYFGGKNIILSKSGIEHHFNEFHSIFTALSGTEIYHAKTEAEVLKYLNEHY